MIRLASTHAAITAPFVASAAGFPGVPIGRHLLGVPLIVLGAVLAVVAYAEWVRNQRALRRGEPLPRSIIPWVLAVTIAGMAVVSAIVLLASALR